MRPGTCPGLGPVYARLPCFQASGDGEGNVGGFYRVSHEVSMSVEPGKGHLPFTFLYIAAK